MRDRAPRNSGSTLKMRDIARHAGVSPMTVSRALRQPSA
ncbi:MAG: LacI family transcriptional regulator, partial [Reyranella sp.]